MNRVAIDLGFIQIYWYSLTMLTGVIIGSLVAYFEIKRHNIKKEDFFNMVFYAVVFGLLGARLYYVLFNLDYYLDYPSEILAVWNGGMAIHGAILGALITMIYFCKKKKMPLLKVLDIGSVSLIIGQVIGRWGNFFNGEAHGGVVSLEFLQKLPIPKFIIDGMYINGNYYHPTFLYESVLNLICFIVLLFLRRNKKIKDGMLVSIYLMWYGIVRFFIEGLRTDSLMLGNIRIAQLVSISLVVFGIIIMVKSRKNEKYNEVKEWK